MTGKRFLMSLYVPSMWNTPVFSHLLIIFLLDIMMLRWFLSDPSPSFVGLFKKTVHRLPVHRCIDFSLCVAQSARCDSSKFSGCISLLLLAPC